MASALGGEIQLVSEEKKGSTFTLFLPASFDGAHLGNTERKIELRPATPASISVRDVPKPLVHETDPNIRDDRYTISPNDRVILIMEDDREFSQILLDFVHERNYKGIIADRGNAGLSYARYHRPDAIMLDMKLPVIGWKRGITSSQERPGTKAYTRADNFRL